MATNLPFTNAIAYAHLQVRGGWKNLGFTTLGSALALGLLIFITLRVNPARPTTMLSTWTSILLAIQTGILVLLGCTTINTALRTDLTTHMIESHRLMPISSWAAILGYIVGGCSQVLCLAATIFLIGLVTNRGAQTPPALWIVPNVVLACFAVFLWLTMLFFGFVTRAGPVLLFIVTIVMLSSQAAVFLLLPGLSVLTSPMIGKTIFVRSSTNMVMEWPLLIAIASQWVISAIFYAAAARRFRHPERPAMGNWLGLAFLAAWVGISTLGVRYWSDFGPAWLTHHADGFTQFMGSIGVSMLLALVPVASAGRADSQWHRARRSGLATARPTPPIVIVLAATAIILVLTIVAPERNGRFFEIRIRVWLVIAAFLLACSYLQRIVYRVNGRGGVIVGIFIVLTWTVPFIIDLVRHSMVDGEDDVFSRITTCSPFGLLMQLWNHGPSYTNYGLAFQLSLLAVIGFLFYLPRLSASKPLSDAPKPL